jgi:hypothetical protein
VIVGMLAGEGWAAWLLVALPILGALIIVAANLSNVIGTWSGRWGSSIVTWSIWAALGWIGLFAQVQMQAWLGAVLLVPVALLSSAVAVGAFWRRRSAPAAESVSWQRWVDRACGVGGVVSLLALLLVSGRDALLLTIVTDGIAAIPTLVAAWRAPETQPMACFAGGAASAACTLLAVPSWSFDEAGYALYLFVLCGVLSAVIAVRRAWRGTAAPVQLRPDQPIMVFSTSPVLEDATGRLPDAAQIMALIPPELRSRKYVPAEQVAYLVGRAWQDGNRAGRVDAPRPAISRPGWVDFTVLRGDALRYQQQQARNGHVISQ